ncbi:MAG: tetratricopeptide repeat protein, partial [Myxococcales bacterium]|nr:tetratricopeptide repeat protein [Myxococcales bacterium]
LAETDDEKRTEKIRELQKRDRDGKSERTLSAFQLRNMARLAKSSGIVDDEPEATTPTSTPTGDTADAATTSDAPESAAERPSGSGDGGSDPRRTTQRDPKESRRLSSEAHKALQSGQRKRAETLFHQALAADNRNGAALIGLSDIHFDRSEYPTAVNYAEKAVQASPKNSGYRIRLGDAYFKLLRYADARREYEVAKSLGNKEADDRLAKVKARLGK